jgi:glycosyltransferase involved in cell wall biosynthesis
MPEYGPGHGTDRQLASATRVPTSIVRLVTRLNIGGPARHALLLTRELSAEFPTLLAAGQPAPDEGELSDPQVSVRRMPLTRQVAPARDARALIAVRSLLTQQRPAILHTHMAKAGTVGRIAARTIRPPMRTVHTFHGHVLEGYFNKRVERAFVEVERRLARRTDLLIAVSPEIRDELLDLGVGRPSQIEVVPIGLDLSAFLAVDGPSGALRRRLDVAADVPLIGIVGRLVPIKDVATMLAATARLPGVHLAVVGDGEDRKALEAEAALLGIADRVHFTGWWHDVAAAMADLDVVVLTSRNEGTPVSLIEALAAGRPVVGTRVGGVPFVVRDGEFGHLVPPQDPTAVADRVRAVLDDPDAARRMGERGRAYVRERFGSERLVDDMRRLYADLLPGDSRSRSVRCPG